jgi:hypothetical protein
MSVGQAGTALGGISIDTNILTAGGLSVEFFGDNGYRTNVSVIPLNTWTHIAITKRQGPINTTTAMFVNGKEIASTASSTNTPNVQYGPLTLGAYSLTGTPGGVANGLIDDAVFYNRELSFHEIRTLASRRGIAYELAPRRRSRVSVLASLRYNIFTGNVGSLEVIGAS